MVPKKGKDKMEEDVPSVPTNAPEQPTKAFDGLDEQQVHVMKRLRDFHLEIGKGNMID